MTLQQCCIRGKPYPSIQYVPVHTFALAATFSTCMSDSAYTTRNCTCDRLDCIQSQLQNHINTNKSTPDDS